MAKKSAKSKGYRKTIKQQPFLTKKDIKALAIIAAIILIGVILFNVITTASYIKAEDVQLGEVVAYASDSVRDRYVKIANVGEIEGFSLQERAEDAFPTTAYYFMPDAETDHIVSVSVNGSSVNAAALATQTRSTMEYYFAESTSEVIETKIQGYNAYVFSTNGSYYQAPEEEAAEEAAEEATEATEEVVEVAQAEDNVYTQNISAYIQIKNGRTLCLHVNREGADTSFYLNADQLVEYVQQYASAFTAK